MQLGLSEPSQAGYSSPSKRDVISNKSKITNVSDVNNASKVGTRKKSEYPASPLITSRPQRYSVLLNDQLTTIQQGDDYLLQLEKILLGTRQALFRGSKLKGKGSRKNDELAFILENRAILSGDSIDLDLHSVTQGKPQVHFQMSQLQELLESSASTSVLFCCERKGNKKFTSVMKSVGESSVIRLQHLNQGLRHFGIRVVSSRRLEGYGLSCDENDWQEIEQSLKVVMDGVNVHANGNVTAIKLKRATTICDQLHIYASSEVSQDEPQIDRLIQQALDTVAEQRQYLAQQQGFVGQLIKNMGDYHRDDFARNTASALSVFLSAVKHSYQVLEHAISGQANFSGLTVKSILTD